MKKSKEAIEAEQWFQSETNKLCEECGMSWCFSKKQFDEYVAKQREKGYDGKFIQIKNLGGAIIRKDKFVDWHNRYVALHKEYKERLNSVLTMDEYIEEQLSDFECYYTGNPTDENVMGCVKAIFPDVTESDMIRVYNESKNRHGL